MISTSTAADNDTNTDEQRSSKRPFGVLGVGAAACAACCAGPILAFLAAAGVFTAAGVALFGVFGLVVLVPAVAWHLRRRRRATACTAPTAGPVAVELGNRPQRAELRRISEPTAPHSSTLVTDRKAIVVRLVTEAINGRNLDVLDEICTPQLAPKLRNAFSSFADAFPDWHQELVELVAEDETVVARFRCHGT